MPRQRTRIAEPSLRKCPTGIIGLDEITKGGLPAGRPTLICGTAGCGKTLMGLEFLVRGATQYNEPGVHFAFEESSAELRQNVRSLGFDLPKLERDGLLHLEYIHLEPAELMEAGAYDLEGLFVRLGLAIDTIGAKRVVLDTIETLFGGLKDQTVLRSELRRLFRWLKEKGVTAIITGERGDGSLTRQGLEEYVADCVILLDHRVIDQISTRRLRIVKYRGSTHGTNEYPFLIDERGIDVLPVTSLNLDHTATSERTSTGVPALDTMLGGGVYKGSTILISGTAGSGKSSLCAHAALAAAKKGQRCLYFAFEESPAQIARNMRSIGLDLEPYMKKDLIRCIATRPVMHGLETHLALIHKHVRDYKPSLLVLDPISDMAAVGTNRDAKSMMVRLIDFLKKSGITAVMSNLTGAGQGEETDIGVSSIVDTWLLLRDIESGGERNRALYILKSRGMAHSNQVREFILTDHGVELRTAYIGPHGALTGSARLSQETRDRVEASSLRQEAERRQRDRERKRAVLTAQIEALRAELASATDESDLAVAQLKEEIRIGKVERLAMVASRALGTSDNGNSRRK